MNEIELQRLYEAQLTAQTRDERIPAHDRNAAAAMLNVSERLMGTRLNPSEEYRTWVFSDPHFEHEASVALFGRPFRNRHHGDGYLLEQWTRVPAVEQVLGALGVESHHPPDGLGPVRVVTPAPRLALFAPHLVPGQSRIRRRDHGGDAARRVAPTVSRPDGHVHLLHVCGREPGCPGPPAQIRTCALTHTAPTSGG